MFPTITFLFKGCNLTAKVVQRSVDALDKAKSSLEALCPRWAECVNDTEVIDDSARLMLLKNNKINKIPDAVKLVVAKMASLDDVCKAVGILDPMEHKLTKDVRGMAVNADAFGRKTVSVAAAVKVLLTSPLDPKSVDLCLSSLKASLPVGLVNRLEVAKGTSSDASPASKGPFKKGPAGKRLSVKEEKVSVADAAARAASSAEEQPAIAPKKQRRG